MNHGNLRKILASMLAVVMVVTAMPYSVYAAQDATMESEMHESRSDEETKLSEETAGEEHFAETKTDTQEIGGEEGTDETQDGREEPATETLEKEETQTDVKETLEGEEAQTDAEDATEESETEPETEEETEVKEDAVDNKSVIGDDYPYKNSCYGCHRIADGDTHNDIDPWSFYYRQCTSFVAWRLNSQNKVAFTNSYLKQSWGNAGNWGNAAKRAGITVDNTPSVGSVWWSTAGTYGHVAWVAEVNGDKVTIEEYNWKPAYGYATRTNLLASSATGYIHINDIDSTPTPPPVERGAYMQTGYYQTIPNGDYHIVSPLGDNWWLTNAGFDRNDGGNVQLWDYSGYGAECDDHVYRFQFIDGGDGRGFYKITNLLSGKCLDSDRSDDLLYDPNTGKRTNVQQWTDCGSAGQQWAINEIDGGDKGMLYTFQARCSGYYMDLEDGKTACGTNISMYKGNGSLAQQWRLVPYAPSVGQTIKDGEYQIVYHAAQNKAIGFTGNGTFNGVNVALSASYKENDKQTFNVKYLGNGYYSIVNKYSGLSLDVTNASRRLATNVELWKYYGATYDAQNWIIKSCGNGYYNIISKYNGLYLDLAGGNTADGTNIQLWKWQKDAAIKWKFIPALPKVAPPTPSIPSGTEVYPGTVLKFYPVSEGTIYYTSDGTDPKTSATKKVYDAWGITIEEPMTMKAYKVMSGYWDSDVLTLTYKVQSKNKLSPPIPNVPSGSVVQAGCHVMLDIGNADTVYYTRDGTNPKSSNTREHYQSTINTGMNGTYPLGIIIYNTVTIKAYAKRQYYEDSDIVEFTYIVGDASENPDPTEPDIPDGAPPNGLWIAEIKPQTYTGKAIKPKVRVYDHKTLLKEKTDYTISYKNNTNANDFLGFKPPTIIVTGKGNYKGKEIESFTISPKNLADADITADNIVLKATGKVQKPVPTITWNNKKLAKKKDYTISYLNEAADGAYVKTGTYTILVKGTGNYTGERKITLTITQDNVKPTKRISLNKANIELQFDKIASYTGNAVNPDRYTLTFTTKDAGGNSNTVTLKEGSDYKVSYQNNVKAGKASILFVGINHYSGTVRKTFNIVPYDIETDAEKKMAIALSDAYAYTKGGCKPKPVVKFGETVLKEGVDYALSYQNNTSLSDDGNTEKLPTVIIKGRGNFKGTCKKTFAIRPKDIGTLTLTAADKTWQNKSNRYQTKIVIKDEDGKALSVGKDYSSTIRYEYDTAVTLADGATKNAKETVSPEDIIPAGTTIRVTVNADDGNYTGTLTGTYRIVKADIGKASVKIPPQIYTGKPIEPDKSEITVKLKGQTLPVEDYDIYCSNNVNKGTATMTIKGKNDCGGTKTVKFKIKEKGFLWWYR